MRLPRIVFVPLRWLLLARAARREPDVVIGDQPDPYLRRWHQVPRNERMNLYLHQFLRSDGDTLHDHPWWNVSIILNGCYLEHVPLFPDNPSAGTRTVLRREGDVVFRRADAAHRVQLHKRRPFGEQSVPIPVWSLFLTGPKVRTWGFWCPRGRWVDFRRYGAYLPAAQRRGCGED